MLREAFGLCSKFQIIMSGKRKTIFFTDYFHFEKTFDFLFVYVMNTCDDLSGIMENRINCHGKVVEFFIRFLREPWIQCLWSILVIESLVVTVEVSVPWRGGPRIDGTRGTDPRSTLRGSVSTLELVCPFFFSFSSVFSHHLGLPEWYLISFLHFVLSSFFNPTLSLYLFTSLSTWSSVFLSVSFLVLYYWCIYHYS